MTTNPSLLYEYNNFSFSNRNAEQHTNHPRPRLLASAYTTETAQNCNTGRVTEMEMLQLKRSYTDLLESHVGQHKNTLNKLIITLNRVWCLAN